MKKTQPVRAARHLLIVAALAFSVTACLGGGGGSEPSPDTGGADSPNPVGGGSSGGDNSSGGSGGGDATSPTVTITDPNAAELETADQSITVGGTASSDSTISTVTWKNNLGGNGAANGTAAWRADNIPLAIGTNTITVTASDADGDFSTDVLIVNRQSSDPDPVTLSWTAPTEREDGSALTSLAGYKLYYGRMSEIYDYEIEISNPGLQTYVVENLEPGEWYFVVTALDAEGLESGYSNEALEQVM